MKKPATVMRNELASLIPQMEDDAVAVLSTIAKRLVMGRKQYGTLRINEDPRDWTKEANEEALDLAVYLAVATLKRC